jgi:copper transport protein
VTCAQPDGTTMSAATMETPMKARRILALSILVALCVPASAWAHANLLRNVPADRAVLDTAPRAVRFVFDDRVRVASGIRAIRNGGGSVLGGKPRVVGGKTLVVPLRSNLRDGAYTVLWRIISDDGHNEAGVISFAVGVGVAAPKPALSATNGPSAENVLARWLFFAGFLVAVGGALFRIAIGFGRVAVLLPAFVLVFVGGGILFFEGDRFATRFGLAFGIAALIAAAGAICAVVPRLRTRAWVAALLLLPIPSFAGHAFDPGRPRVEVFVDILHLAAAAVWTGGLVQLLLALRAGEERERLLRRFSTLALVAVVVIAATGVGRAVVELRSVHQVWTTGYGRLLIAKTGLLGVLVAIGWVNRYRLAPRGSVGVLRRNVAVELVLLTGIVVVVSILTDARPGVSEPTARAAAPAPVTGPPPAPPSDAVVLAQENGFNAVALAVEPQRMQVTVLGPDGLGVKGEQVTIAGKPASVCGAGCYEAATGARGVVVVRVNGRRLVFDVPSVAPSAASIVADAGRVFRQLRGVHYVERLASSPFDHLVTRFTLERPNRVAYRISGGSDAIVIGTRRWDSNDGVHWQESQSGLLPQPTPPWTPPVTNAHVLARTARTLRISFYEPSIPAWFVIILDARTMHPRDFHMTATAHFMRDRYTAINAPRRIFPPH